MIYTDRSLNQTGAWRLTPIAVAICSLGLFSLPAQAAPQGGVLRAGVAAIAQTGATTRIEQRSDRAVIDWRSFSIGARETVQFKQPSTTSATLNRVTGEQISAILGRLNANGQIVLVNPHGILFGQGAQINVGSLIASTANLSTPDFMAGRLNFNQPGQPGAEIINQGTLSAADGGLIALVAPHVRNDGLIQARLGKILLGAGDTYTLDLYGDGLIKLALSDEQHDRLITHTGKSTADGGHIILITAPAAKTVLDQIINLSGTLQADSVAHQAGRIVLLAPGGRLDLSGSASAQGPHAGQRGGTIEILGDRLHLAGSARLDASGHSGGGTLHIGGAYQGQGDTYRAQTTTVDAGAQLNADATSTGSGGEVIVWADGHTAYAGQISARGGAQGGDGGRVEVSGKGALDFQGSVDAGAPHGAAGNLLLDPAYLTIGLAEASLISRVLRTGTSTTLAADIDINVNASIDGRGRRRGGGLTFSAGHDININDFIVTDNGLINLLAGGRVTMAPGKGLFAGSAPISVRAAGNITTGLLLTSAALSVTSTEGSIDVNGLIDADTRAVAINAAHSLTVNQPILNLRSGAPLTLSAGDDLIVNAQVDGRGGVAGGAATLTAGNNAMINSFIVTNNGPIRVDAALGNASVATDAGLYAGSAPITLGAASDITTGRLISSGPLSVVSRAGSITVSAPIDGASGPLSLDAANDVVVAQSIVNARADAPLTIAAGRDIVVNAQIDGRDADPAASGSINLTAGRNVELAKSVITENAALNVTARSGTVHAPTVVAGSVTLDTNGRPVGEGLYAGSGTIAVSTGGDLSSGVYGTTGTLALRSTAGSVNVDTPIDGATGAVSLNAARDVVVAQAIVNSRADAPLTIAAERDIVVSAQIDGRDANPAAASGTISLSAGRHVDVARSVITEDAALNVAAHSGTVRVATGAQLRSGSGSLTVSAGSDLYVGDPAAAKPNADTPYITSGTLNVSSTAGTLYIEAPIPDSTGPLNLVGSYAVRVNERIYSNDRDISITAGAGGIVMNTDTIVLPTGAPAPDDAATIFSSDTNARLGNLTLRAEGDIYASSLRTAGTLSVTSTAGRIVGGSAEATHVSAGGGHDVSPRRILLSAPGGITGFDQAYALDAVDVTSSGGAINLGATGAARVRLTAPSSSIAVGSLYGADVALSSGQDINLISELGGDAVSLTAGRDLYLPYTVVDSLTMSAGRDIRFSNLIWLRQGDLSASAGRDIVATDPGFSNVHITGGHGLGPFHSATFAAGGSIELRKVETLGDVRITASTGNIKLNAPIGPAYQDPPLCVNNCGEYSFGPSVYREEYVPLSVPNNGIPAPGVLSLFLSAPNGAIDMAGARTLGSFAATFGSGMNSSRQINGSGFFPGAIVENIPIAVQDQLLTRLGIPGAPVPPGPLPAAPQSANGIVALAPIIPNVTALGSAGAPGTVDGLGAMLPAADGGEIGSVASEAAHSVAQAAILAGDTSASDSLSGSAAGTTFNASTDADAVLVFSGGRGEALSADLGRGGAFGSAFDVFAEDDPDARRDRRRSR